MSVWSFGYYAGIYPGARHIVYFWIWNLHILRPHNLNLRILMALQLFWRLMTLYQGMREHLGCLCPSAGHRRTELLLQAHLPFTNATLLLPYHDGLHCTPSRGIKSSTLCLGVADKIAKRQIPRGIFAHQSFIKKDFQNLHFWRNDESRSELWWNAVKAQRVLWRSSEAGMNHKVTLN